MKKEFAKKESSISALQVVESKSNSEYYSRPKSIPMIKIATEVGGVFLPSSLADCGAMINVISEDKVTKYDIPTCSILSMQIHEPLNLHGTQVDKKVISKVRIPVEKWKSRQLTEFVVALLAKHDTILRMPFLAKEGILIDSAQSKMILPTVKASFVYTENNSRLGLNGICKDELCAADEIGIVDMK